MKLIHTSPTEITKIDRFGTFGSHLFFSANEYVMTAGSYVTYEIEISEDEIIEARDLFNNDEWQKALPVVEEVMEEFGVDEQTAMNLLDESELIQDVKDDLNDIGEASWKIQRLTAKAAKLIGFRAVEVTDEQGTSWMVDMLGREADLKIYTEEE